MTPTIIAILCLSSALVGGYTVHRVGARNDATSQANADVARHTAGAARAAGEAAASAVRAAEAANLLEARTSQALALKGNSGDLFAGAIAEDDPAKAGALLQAGLAMGCFEHVEGAETGAGLGCQQLGAAAAEAAQALGQTGTPE